MGAGPSIETKMSCETSLMFGDMNARFVGLYSINLVKTFHYFLLNMMHKNVGCLTSVKSARLICDR